MGGLHVYYKQTLPAGKYNITSHFMSPQTECKNISKLVDKRGGEADSLLTVGLL